MAVFVKDPVGWNDLTRNPKGIIGRDLTRRGMKLSLYARVQVGKKTRKLASSITTETSLDMRGLVNTTGSSNKIARLHHDGTRAHVIKPRKARVLRFVHRGRIRYAKRVWHPGTRPNRYLTDNLKKVVID